MRGRCLSGLACCVDCRVSAGRWRLWSLVLLLLLQSCASVPLETARAHFHAGDYQLALDSLADKKRVRARDRLLFWMDRGLIEHVAGDWQSSVRSFHAAIDWVDRHDYISLSEEGSSLLVNDWARDYVGERSEQLWLHSYQIMNYLLLGQYESAAVEARRAIRRIDRHRALLSRDAFTQSLIILAFQSAGFHDESCVQIRRLLSDHRQRPVDLSDRMLAGLLLPCRDLADRVSSELLAETNARLAGRAEVIVFVSDGRYPRKFSSEFVHPPDIRLSFPGYLSTEAPGPVPVVQQGPVVLDVPKVSIHLGDLAVRSLNDRALSTVTRHAARLAAKRALARRIEDSTETGALLVRLAAFVTEQADLRGWETLPGRLTLLRIPVVPAQEPQKLRVGQRTLSLPPVKAGDRLFLQLPGFD